MRYGFVGVTEKPSGSHLIGKPPMFMPKTSKTSLLGAKRMPIVFFNVHGVLHYEFIPKGQTVNQRDYTGTLRHLWENV